MAIINQYVVALTCLMTKFIPNSSMGKKTKSRIGNKQTNKQKTLIYCVKRTIPVKMALLISTAWDKLSG